MALPDPTPVQVDQPTINACIYGPPGTGKTVLAATAADHPALSPVIIGNFEGGLLSLGNRYKDKVKQVRIKTLDDVEELFWAVVNKKAGYEHFKTVILDSGSEMQTLSLEHLALAGYKKQKAEGKSTRESMDHIFQEDYGKDTARLKRIFRWYRDAPFNFIVTALAKKVFSKPPKGSDQDPVLLDVTPAFTDKLGQAVMGYVDYVWYTFRETEEPKEKGGSPVTKFKILTSEKGVYKAKTRGMEFSKAIGQTVEFPNIGELYEKLLESEMKSSK